MNSYKTIATCLALALSQTVAAGPIDVAQARTNVLKQVAQQKSNVSAGKRYAPAKEADFKHVYTEKTQTGTPAVYVFNSPQGFVLAAADDAVPSLLGYSDSGDFDPNNIPDGLQYLMGEYAREIASLPNRAATQLDYKVQKTDPVKPLLETNWDQQHPYNLECPFALSSGTNFAATGCMTTALAQIMRFHKWPETTGFGSCEMEAQEGAKKKHVERYYYQTTYNWDIMPMNKSRFTDEGAREVSKLMMDVAVALRTEFGGSSGATELGIIPMFLSFFNYDPGIEIVSLNDKGAEEFNSIVIADLQAGRPVYFQGTPPSGGHAFVCDGYDGAGLFHINWGWSGTSDGYYRVTGLTPKEAGTGGNAGAGYSTGLKMVHNIKPYKDGVVARPEIKANYSRDTQPGITLQKVGSAYRFGGNFGVYPGAPQYRNIRATMGLYIEKPNGTKEEKWMTTVTQILRNAFDKSFSIDVDASLLTDGTKVSYIYKETGESKWLYVTDSRGDRCTFCIKRNDKGELLATAGEQVYVLEGPSAPDPSSTVAITYNINLNGSHIGTKVVNETPGAAPSKDFVPEFYVKAEGFPEKVPSTPTTYTINTSYKETMPFEPNGSRTYNMSFCVGGNTYMWYIDGNTAKEQKNPAQSAGNNQNTKWRFKGNWLDGFNIQNANDNKYLQTPVDDDYEEYRILTNSALNSNYATFLLLHRDEGFYFKHIQTDHYLAHIQPTSLEASLYYQKYYAGNIVTITNPGEVPQAPGVNYTVKFSGMPEDKTPSLQFEELTLGEGGTFHAVDLDKSMLKASNITNYDSNILVGANTVYVVYTPGSIISTTYKVNITGNYPTDAEPVLEYNNQTYKNGDPLTATNLTLMQLSASQYENYSCTISITSSAINVTYKNINYKEYTVQFSGLPDNRNPKLFYNTSAVEGSTFTAGDLTLDQLSATYYPDYGRKITLDEVNHTIKVEYYSSELFFNTYNRTQNGKYTLTQFPVTITYYSDGPSQNIYGTGNNATKVTSSEASITKIVFKDPRNFTDGVGVNSNVGDMDKTTGTWKATSDTKNVTFTGGDAYASGMYVYLSIPECEHNIVDGVCLLCGHGFMSYAANEKVNPNSEAGLLGEGGNALTIVKHTFEDGMGLIEFDAPLAAIGDNAFAGCSGLTGRLAFSRHLKSIGNLAFSGCSGLTTMEFASVPAVASTAFDGMNGEILLNLDDQSYVSTASTSNFPSRTSATYTRQMNNQWGTVVVPFSVAASSDDYELYELTHLNSDVLVLSKMHGTIAAGTPTVVCMNESACRNNKYTLTLAATDVDVNTSSDPAATTVDGLTLKGSYCIKDITAEHGFIISKNKFWNIQQSKGTNNVYNAPFRSYISAASPTLAREMSLSLATEDSATGLDTLNSLITDDGEIYDLRGISQPRLQSGINIIKHANGKTSKIIIK